MIDTVILRVHNVAKYAWLVDGVDFYNKDGYTTEVANVPQPERLK